jgi:predicted deacylase
VINAGRASELAGEPRAIGGHTRARSVYAPAAGRFRTRLDIGAIVVAGEAVGSIGDEVLFAPLSGCLRTSNERSTTRVTNYTP